MTAPRFHASARFTGIALVLAMHLALIWVALQYKPMRQQLAKITPIMVSLVAPPTIAPPQKVIPPAPVAKKQRPKKTAPLPSQTVPLIAATAPAPVAAWEPPSPPDTHAASAEPAATLPAIAPPHAPMPITLPSFNANYLNNPPPPYPTLSRRMGEEGKVILRVFVDEHGLPAQVQIKTSSGHNRLDSTALETVRQWKFIPARLGEQALGAWVLVPISFSLRS